MTWFQIALLVLQLLKQLKGSADAEQFVSNVQASGSPFASGDFLRWLWENREQVIELIQRLIGMIPKAPPATTLAEADAEVDVLAEIEALLAE
jgi:hypothetical protein